ncbi:TetR family transcriptional regulator [Conexibacter sp. W3-3-2]|nr:TetR family transcriptional regulator [Conexibacter sp. W3-3-2]
MALRAAALHDERGRGPGDDAAAAPPHGRPDPLRGLEALPPGPPGDRADVRRGERRAGAHVARARDACDDRRVSARRPSKDPQDWIDAALAAVEEGGLAAVAVEPLARRLGVTKGSFYHHFADRPALLRAMLAAWEDRFVRAQQVEFDAIPDPRERLHRLLHLAYVDLRPTVIVRLLAAVDDPDVAQALARAAEVRIGMLERTFRQLGLPPARARHRAAATYGAYLGLAQLRTQVPDLFDSPRALRAHVRDLEAALLHDLPDPAAAS